jgi:hypothetical protein
MIGIGCIDPIQTSNRFQASAASERGSMASESVKLQSGTSARRTIPRRP